MGLPELCSWIEACARETADEQDIELPGDFSADTPLFGKDGLLDSLALVSLVVAVEQRIEDETGVGVALADERAMSQSSSPFRSVNALATYAKSLIDDAG